MIRLEIRHDERDGLRMFVLYEVEQLCGIGLAQEVEGAHLKARREAVDDLERLVRAERLLQDILRILQAARGNVILRHAHRIKLGDNFCLKRR